MLSSWFLEWHIVLYNTLPPPPPLPHVSFTLLYSQVWFFDGSIECFHGVHLFLALLAMFFLLVGLLLIFAVAVITYQRELRRKVGGARVCKRPLNEIDTLFKFIIRVSRPVTGYLLVGQ